MCLGQIPAIFLTLIAITTTATLTTAETTAVTATATAAPATAAIITARVTFKSVKGTFTDDLMHPSSAAFTSRASMIKTQLEPFCQKEIPFFKFLDVVSFRNGSIVNEMNFSFEGTSVPNNTQIAGGLISAASNITDFDIDTNSITVNGITSSGVNHKTSLTCASCLALLSWLLSNQQ